LQSDYSVGDEGEYDEIDGDDFKSFFPYCHHFSLI
jgi:hypothetical protein